MGAVLHSDSFLPRTTPGVQKSFWTYELSDLKQKSIECCKNWRAYGCPKSGPVYLCKLDCTSKYKLAVRWAKREFTSHANDNLYSDLTAHNSQSFWKTWRNRCKEADSSVTRIDGEVTDRGIAGAFRKHFCNVYSGHDSPSHEALKSEFSVQFESYSRVHANDSISPHFLSWANMVEVAGKLKLGKSSSGFIKPEHVFHGSTKLMLHLHLLFNAMIQHGIVPGDFLHGTITPIVVCQTIRKPWSIPN